MGIYNVCLFFIAAVYSYLAEDLAKEKLSSTNKKNRNLFIQRLDGLIKKIKLANENTPPLSSNNSHPPPSLPQRPPPLSKPPPIPPTTDNDDGGEVYEVPDKDTSEQYTSFLPIATEDEPQVSLINIVSCDLLSCDLLLDHQCNDKPYGTDNR